MMAAVTRPGGAAETGEAFRQQFDALPDGVWAAPGRVNLIGEHTDYNEGFVLPFALPQRTTVAARRRRLGSEWSVWSANESARVSFGTEALVPGAVAGWAGYVAGVVWALRDIGADVGGAELVVTSDVPVGAGLSSSAALECSVVAALDELYELGLRPMDRALIAQRAENDYVGMPCGIMDQAASTVCTMGHALLLDCRTGELEQIPLDTSKDLTLLLIDPHAPHQLIHGEYAARRAGCEAAAAVLGLPALRDATEDDLGRLSGDERRLARHVVSENARVLATVDMLRRDDLTSIGPLLVASHESLRDDFRVSVAELDLAVDSAVAGGALGARMTGGGFGGTIIALVAAGAVSGVESAVSTAFASRGLAEPRMTPTQASAGAGRVS